MPRKKAAASPPVRKTRVASKAAAKKRTSKTTAAAMGEAALAKKKKTALPKNAVDLVMDGDRIVDAVERNEKAPSEGSLFAPLTARRIQFSRAGVQSESRCDIPMPVYGEAVLQSRLVRINMQAVAFWQGKSTSPLPEDCYTETLLGEVVAVGPGVDNVKVGQFVVTHVSCQLQEYVVVPAYSLLRANTASAAYLDSPVAYARYITTDADKHLQTPARSVLVLGSTALAYLCAARVGKDVVHYAPKKLSLLQGKFDLVFDCRGMPDFANAARFVEKRGLYVSACTGRCHHADMFAAKDDEAVETFTADGTPVMQWAPTQSSMRYVEEFWLPSIGNANPLLATHTKRGKLSDIVSAMGHGEMSVVVDMVN